MARNSKFVFLAKQIEMPDIRVYKALHSRFAVHNVQKRSTLLWPRSHRHARDVASLNWHPSERITTTPRFTWRPLQPPASVTTPIRPGLRKTAIVFPINYIALPSLRPSFPVPGTCSGLGHGLNTMDRREVQSHQEQSVTTCGRIIALRNYPARPTDASLFSSLIKTPDSHAL